MTAQTFRVHRRFPRLRSAAALTLAVAMAPAALMGQGAPQPLQTTPGPAMRPVDTTTPPVWPANTKLLQAKLVKIVLPNEKEPNNFPVPQLRVYDKQGRRVLERLGYYAPTFSAFLTRALTGGMPADDSRLLAYEMDLVLAPDGTPITTLPDADYTIVDYWASWCLPCRAQDQDLVKVLTANSSVRVNLLKVEADTSQKTPQEVMQMLQAGRDSVAARKKPQG